MRWDLYAMGSLCDGISLRWDLYAMGSLCDGISLRRDPHPMGSLCLRDLLWGCWWDPHVLAGGILCLIHHRIVVKKLDVVELVPSGSFHDLWQEGVDLCPAAHRSPQTAAQC
jgi:hypothetical protein